MDKRFTDELLRHMKPTLQLTYSTQDTLPLQLKLRLERLRLAEIIRLRCRDAAHQIAAMPPSETAAAPAYAMT